MYSLILLNGGIGARFGAKKPKQLLKLNGIPVLVYSLLTIDEIDEVDEIILNYPEGWKKHMENIIKNYSIKKKIVLMEAGSSRHNSVKKMLHKTKNKKIIIHESARPMIKKQSFIHLIHHKNKNVSYAQSIPFTVAPVNPKSQQITGSLDRSLLRNIQLPQKFDKEELLNAHLFAEQDKLEFTEDSTLLVSAGYEVYFTEGKEENIKITTPLDLEIVTNLLNRDILNE